jgi:hypothetical protein
MKRVFFYVVLSCVILASCNNSAKDPTDVTAIMQDSSKYTTIKWKDTAIDFGAKKTGEIVNLTFVCINTGNKPLYLFEVHPSCGCTLVDYSKAPIAPGQQGKIDAQFDTKKSHSPEVHKTIFVRTNSNDPSRYLSFSGTVISDSSTAKN